MKKLKMFLSIILIAALCLMPEFDIFAKSAGNKSFGQVVESGVAANLDKSAVQPELQRAKTLADTVNSSSSVLIYDKNMNEVSKATPYYYSKFSEFKATKLNTFYFSVPAAYGFNTVVPIHINRAGVLIYSLAKSSDDGVMDSGFGLYSNKTCTAAVKSTDRQATIKKAGTYYLKINKSAYAAEEDTLFCGVFGLVSNSNVELTNNVSVISSILSAGKPIYYKIHVYGNAAKVMTQITTDSHSYVTLCNSKKEAIAKQEYIKRESGKVFYVLKKGIYYLRVKAPVGYVVAETDKETVTDSSGAGWSKAGVLKLNGKTKSALLFLNDSTKKTYYFKFTNPTTQKIYLNVDSSFTSGQARIEFFDAKGSSYGTDTLNNGIAQSTYFTPYSVSYYNSSAKTLPAGTYYVKFTKKTADANGIVNVNVKNRK